MRRMLYRSPRRALTTVFFVHGAAIATWAVRIPAAKHALQLSTAQLSIALLGGTLGGALSLLTAARLVARLGSTRVLRLGLVCATAVLAVLGLMPTLVTLTLSLAAFAWSLGITDVAMNAKGVLLEKRRARPLLSGLHAGWSAGNAVGALAGFVITQLHVPLEAHLAGVAVVGLLTAFPAASALATLEHVPPVHAPSPSQVRVHAPLSQRLRGLAVPAAVLLPLAALTFFGQIGEGAGYDWSALLLSEGLHHGDGAGAAGLAALVIAMTLARTVGDRLALRIGQGTLVGVGGALSAAGLAAALSVGGIVVPLIGLALLGGGLANLVPIMFRMAGARSGVSPAVAISMLSGTAFCAGLVSPPTVGVLATHVGLRNALWVIVACTLVVPLLSPAARGRPADQPAESAGPPVDRDDV
jgi:MFS family permease